MKATPLCELALVSANLAKGEGVRAKLRSLAWAHLGNALRVKNDFEGAERAFVSSDELWKSGEGSAEGPFEEGLIFALKASLRRAQRRFDEAKNLLERASLLASGLTLRIQIMVSKAKLLEETGNLSETVALLEQVKEIAPPKEEARILFPIWHNLADALSKLHRFQEATALLPQAHAYLLKAGGELNRVRLLWTEGRVTVGLGNVKEGIALLARVRGEFASRNMAYDMALVSLEIAFLQASLGCAERGRALLAPLSSVSDIPTLETQRLRLRPLRESDFEDYAALYADPEVVRYLGTGGEPWDRGRSWRHMAFQKGHWDLTGTGLWAVAPKETGAFLGLIGFAAPEGWPGFELAWTLARRWWGNGYATEGARAALDHAFTALGKDRVISLIHPENRASIRVAERIGESPRGRILHFGREMLCYGIDRETYLRGCLERL